MVEYNYDKGTQYKTFGLVEKIDKNHIWVQWLWNENLQGKPDPESRPRQNYLIHYNKDEDGGCTRLILIS